MSDRLRPDLSRALDAASDADRDAKIEQLLLVGLDHYFVAQYDQAINVWTRVLFLDRSHARARAYIERARSALAERQRESEELLETGVAAFRRGDSDEARRLLQAAVDGGASPDEALPMLDRLKRLEATAPSAPPVRSRRSRLGGTPRAGRTSAPASGLALSLTFVLALIIAGISAATAWGALDWRALLALPGAPVVAAPVPVSRDQGLPLPTRGEHALARARVLASDGRLHDALASLDLVRPTDPQRPDADRLRGELQRQLISLGSAGDGKVSTRTP
jgi:tetratricopeptide (TPR) repeat protein